MTDPITKEELPALVKEVTTQMAQNAPHDDSKKSLRLEKRMENTQPRVVVRDLPDANASYTGYNSPDSHVDQITINKPLLTLLTPRELKSVIAHMVAHREDYMSGKSAGRNKVSDQDFELAADKKSVQEWGDVQAYNSALNKIHKFNQQLGDRDHVIAAEEYGLITTSNAARKYDKADDAGKAQMAKDARDAMEKDKKTSPLLETEQRIALVNQTVPTAAMTAKADKDANIAEMQKDAKAITADASAETVRNSLNDILKRSGQKELQLTTVPTGQQAADMGKKLQDNLQKIYDEQPGYDNRILSATILQVPQKESTQVIPELNTTVKSGKPIDHAIAKAGNLDGLNMLQDLQHSPLLKMNQIQTALQKIPKALG